jgi:hypothetical protein
MNDTAMKAAAMSKRMAGSPTPATSNGPRSMPTSNKAQAGPMKKIKKKKKAMVPAHPY